jgi:hypothetical protein
LGPLDKCRQTVVFVVFCAGQIIAKEEEKDEKEGIADIGLQYLSCFHLGCAVPGTGD